VAGRLRRLLSAFGGGARDAPPARPEPTLQPAAPKIQLTVGFANLSGDDLGGLVAEDTAAFSGLFERVNATAPGQVPNAEVLFVYGHLNDDGTLQGVPSGGIRQIVQLTRAAIVVLASPNTGERIKSAAALPGPKSANIVFTVDRNREGFARFFRALFELMRDGENMLAAWVKLAPQHAGATSADAPSTMLLAEAGKLVFPNRAAAAPPGSPPSRG
jgi:hypothetical protein